MQDVIIHLPEPGFEKMQDRTRIRTMRLRPGQSVAFGYRRADRALAVASSGDLVDCPIGRITAAPGYWLLSNFSPASAYLVENIGGTGEHIKVQPRRRAAPIPFELSRVVVPGDRGPVSLYVRSPAAPVVDSVEVVAVGPGGVALDPNRKYFLVLVALCEPQLLGEWRAGVPSVPEVVERLRQVPGCEQLTRNAVNYHIDYLAERKLRDYLGEERPAVRVRWKREALVSVALRYDLVRRAHLALLPTFWAR